MYDVILRGEDPHSFGEAFWAEFFLLRPKVALLEAELAKALGAASGAEAAGVTSQAVLRRNLNLLFSECLDNLGQEHHIRVVYALQTLCGLLRALTRRQASLGAAASGFDLVNLLVGFDVAEQKMLKLFAHINE